MPFDRRQGVIWMDGEFVDWQDARIHVLTHGLHYASCVYEGERAYDGQIFALAQHTRRLQALKNTLTEPWEKALASIAFATVAEISVNAFLAILADDQSIQPAHSALAQMHNRDEYAHSKTLGEISKVLYDGLAEEKKKFFVRILPQALSAFVAQDYSMWEVILSQLKVPGYETIIADCYQPSRSGVIMRDFTGLHRFAQDVGILDVMEFDFSGTVATKAASASH